MIMKTIITERKWKAIYRLLDRVSPINYDCGKLCGASCCTVSGDYSDEMMGIYLYPGEEKSTIQTAAGSHGRWKEPRTMIFPIHGREIYISCAAKHLLIAPAE